MEFLEQIEAMRAEEASYHKLFNGEGQSAKAVRTQADYQKKFQEALKLVGDVMSGKKSERLLREAMTTSDFPLLFGDILDRQVLASYKTWSMPFRNYVKISTVRDFRSVKRFTTNGGDNVLSEVQEQGEYPESKMGEGSYSYAVKKYGRRMPFSWESMINDDLDALKDIPTRFGRAAARSEQKFATELYVGSSGANDNLYKTANNNIISGNPALDIDSLQSGLELMAKKKDSNGEPIMIDVLHLVVPPALEIVAENILNSVQLEITGATGGGTSNQKLITANWLKNRLRLHVDPYIPIVSNSSNGNTCWFLFADPGNNRPALEMGFLRGHESPEVFVKSPNAMRPGGGNVDTMSGDFDTDSIQYKVRHVFGGTRMDPKMTVASDGSGSAE